MKTKQDQLKELARLRKEIREEEPLTWSRTACPHRVYEAMEKIGRLRLQVDELKRRIAHEG